MNEYVLFLVERKKLYYIVVIQEATETVKNSKALCHDVLYSGQQLNT